MRARRIARAIAAGGLLAAVAILALPERASATLGFGQGSGQNSDQPISIDAEDGIEWQQAKQVYIARGNAVASQGGVTVRADSLTAHYRTGSKGDTEIWRIVADGNVRISTDKETATGDKGVYDIDNGVLVMTGKIVRLDTPTEKISAKQSLEYWDTKRIAIARGDAVAIKDGRELRADVLTAHLKETKRGALELARMEAFGNVEVATQSEVARAQYGDYNPDTGIANMAGSVKISRGTSQLNGEFAEVNMKTGVSRLLAQPKGTPSNGKRVRGVMQPESKGGAKGVKASVPQPPAPVNP